MNEIRPIIDPLLNLLRSRKVMTALVALVVSLLIAAFPDLQPVRSELYTVVLVLALALIGGTTIEDAARKARQTPDPLKPPKEAARDLGDEVLDKLPSDEPETPKAP